MQTSLTLEGGGQFADDANKGGPVWKVQYGDSARQKRKHLRPRLSEKISFVSNDFLNSTGVYKTKQQA
jgi:hypothetical protein